MMMINSPEDRFVLWQGGDMKRGKGGQILSVPDVVDFWKRSNGCGAVEEKKLPKNHPGDPTQLVMQRHTGCRGNSTVVLYKIESGGHTWPGGKDQPPWLVGVTSEELSATTASWNFFEQYTLPE